MRVVDISLPDVAHKYLKLDVQREGNSNRYKMTCPFHKDSSPSLILFDKTDKGKGWDYHCFVCGAHGTAPTLLTEMKITPDEESAQELLRQDYNMVLPDKVTVTHFAEYKGLSKEFLTAQDWKDSSRGVVIPFFDTRGELVCEKIRTKYKGKDKYIYGKGDDTHAVHNLPYGLHWLEAYEPTVLYIAEGETDCITLRQAGFQSLGIMGANGFNPAYAPYLEKFQQLVLVRDNDEAGWHLVKTLSESFPDKLFMISLPKNTKDINNYHQYRCGADPEVFKRLFETLPLLPATPDTFMKAVKSGECSATEQACWQMVVRFTTSKAEVLDFKDKFSKFTGVGKATISECLKIALQSKVEPERDDREFTVANNCYYKQVFRGDRVVEERISNFIIEPQYDINSDGDIIRVVNLINDQSRVARGVQFTGESLSAASKFNQRCITAGDYIFTGTQEDLFQLCVVIFNTPKRIVHSPKRIGRLETGGWLFSNCGIDKSGAIVPVEDGLVNLDGVSYAPRSISVDDDGGTADLPSFNLTPQEYDIARYAQDFRKTFGTFGAWLALGWCVAGWFSDALFEKFGYFPYLFVTGKRSSGKSVMCTMLQSTFGFSSQASGASIETPTNVGILRYLSYRASLPQWYDDYRNDVKRITAKDGLLLDVYNRHGAIKGTKEGAGIRQEKINGYLLLSGEDTPQNNALLTRCVVVTLSAHDRDASHFLAAQDGMAKLRNYSLRWAQESAKGNTADLMRRIDECNAEIFKRCADARYSGNVAIFLGAFLWAFGDSLPIADVKALCNYVYGNSALTTAEQNAEHPLAQFFNEFSTMSLHGDIIQNRDYKLLDSPKRIALRLNDCHHAWENLRRTGALLTRKTLRGYIEKEPFYLGEERVYFDGVGRQRCIVLALAHMEAEFGDFVDFVLRDEGKPDY